MMNARSIRVRRENIPAARRVIGPLLAGEFDVQLDGYEPGLDDAAALDILRAHLDERSLRRPADPDAARALWSWTVDLANHWDAMLEAAVVCAGDEIEGLTRAEARRLRGQLGDVARWLIS